MYGLYSSSIPNQCATVEGVDRRNSGAISPDALTYIIKYVTLKRPTLTLCSMSFEEKVRVHDHFNHVVYVPTRVAQRRSLMSEFSVGG